MPSMLVLPIVTAGQIATVPSPVQLPTQQPEGAIRYSQSDDTLYTFDGITWNPVAGGGGGAVVSVNGQTGVVLLNSDDIPEGATNFYYTPSRLQTDLNSGTFDASFDNLSANVISQNVNIEDNIIILNSAVVGAPTLNAGIEINRGSSTDAQILWNETTDTWQAGLVGNLKNIIALDSISAISPVAYNNTNGQISLTTVPISLGGTGQTSRNPALNALLPPQTGQAGKFLASDGADATWAVTPAPTGTAEHLAYYNSLGDLDSLLYWYQNGYGGVDANVAMTAPADAGDVYPRLMYMFAGIETPVTTTQYHPEGIHVEMGIDLSASSNDLDSVYTSIFSSTYNGNGTLRYMGGLDVTNYLGNNTNTATVDSAAVINAQGAVRTNITNNNLQLYNGAIQNDGIMTGYAALINVSMFGAGSTNTIHGVDVNITSAIDQDAFMFNAYGQPSMSVGNNFFGVNIGMDGDITNNAIGFNLNQNGAVGQNLSALSLAVNADLGTTAANFHALVNAGFFGTNTYEGTLAGVYLNFQGPESTTQDVQMFSGQNKIGAINYRGLDLYTEANFSDQVQGIYFSSKGNARTLTGAQVFLDTGVITDDAHGFRLGMQPGFQAESFKGLSVDVQGTFTDYARGAHISVSQAIVTNPALPAPQSLTLEGGTWNFNSEWTPVPGSTFATGNVSIATMNVPLGTPITGDEVLTHAFITQSIIQDDMTPGPIGLGNAAFASVHNLAVATGKTVFGVMQNMILASTLQNPGFADAGVVQDFRALEIVGILPFGGSTVVNSFTGISLKSGFDGLAPENWGILVDGSNADNYLNKLAINTVSKKVTDSHDKLEVRGSTSLETSIIDEGYRNLSLLTTATANTLDVNAIGMSNTLDVEVTDIALTGSFAYGTFTAVERNKGLTDVGTVSTLIGNFSSVAQTDTDPGAVTDVAAAYASIVIGNSGTITSGYDFLTIDTGSTNITTRYGLYVDIDGATPKQNWISGTIQLGDASYSAPTNDSGVYLARPTQFFSIDTAGRLALTVNPGTHVYDSTLNQMAYWNGTIWVLY